VKKKRLTEGQIAHALAQESTGQTIAEICRKLGVSEQTFCRWTKKFGSMGVAEVRRLKQLEDENAKLKRLVADLSLDKAILQDVLRKSLTPGQRRGLVGYARDAYRVTEHRVRRVLTVVDQYTREALATEARGSFSAHDVIDVLNRLARSHRKPAVIQVDNGTEFASRALDAWAYREDVRLDFSRPGKPTDNAHVESFNARLRAECLSAHVFESLEDAEETLTSWRSDYNAVRPHSALGMLAPREFAELGQRSAGH